MVLKKPYALLIKYFRHIHVFLAAVTAVILFSLYNIYSVFSTYTTNGWLSAKNMILDHNYISSFLVILIIINVTVLVVLYILMKYKDKPRLFYILSIIINILLAVLLIFDNSVFNQITQDAITSSTLRLYRDISAISLLVVGILLLILLIRSVGFDIQKFDFGKDLQEFKVTSEDSEEFELQLEVDDEEYKRRIRKRIREFKIYYKENKFIVNTIFTIIAVIIIFILSSIFIFNNTYKEQKNVKIDKGIRLRVNNSYITQYNDYGEKITDDMILIVEFNIINTSDKSYSIDTNMLNISQEGSVIHPITTEYTEFFMHGIGYTNQTLEKSTDQSYYVIYEIEKQDKYNKLFLTYNNKKIRIKPKELETEEGNIPNTALGETIIFDIAEDASIKFKVGGAVVSDNFNYATYVDGELLELNTLEGEKKENETIIKLIDTELVSIVDGEEILWETIEGNVECIVNGMKKVYFIRTAYTYYNNSTIFLIVPNEVKNAEKITLWLNFLDSTINYTIKK